MILDQVVPWGRSLREYERMFDLSPAECSLRILDCAAGPSSFNAEMHQGGYFVTSCDPVYPFSQSALAARIEETCPAILAATRKFQANFVWSEICSVEELEKLRRSSMALFLDDLAFGLAQGRYIIAELPNLCFRDREFDLSLCSHFLFTYSNVLTLEFHVASIREMCRVARETRIFPLIEQFGSGPSAHLTDVLGLLRTNGYHCEISPVPYEFQRGGNEMLRVFSPA
jgi:hypothetical protein